MPYFRGGKTLHKLSSRLAVISFGVAILVSLSVSLIILRMQSDHLREELKHMGISIAKNLSMSSGEFLLNNDLWNLYKLCRSIIEEDTTTLEAEGHHINVVEYAMVLDSGGILKAHSNPLKNKVGFPLSLDDPLFVQSLNSEGLLIQKTESGGHDLYDISFPVRITAQKIGSVRIGVSEKMLDALLQKTRDRVLAISLSIALLCGALSQFLARWITSPIETLGRFQEAFDPNSPDYAHIPPIKSSILEINSLNDILQRMSLKITETLQDIRRKKEDIRAEKEKLESILNGIGAGMVVVDKNRDMIWSNKVFSTWFEDTGTEAKLCYHCFNQQYPCTECPASKTFRTGEVCTVTHIRKTRVGMKYFKIITVPWRNPENEIAHVFELSLDITEKAELEKRLKNSERVALIGELAASMAHEIRNPLSSLVSSIDLLHKGDSSLSQDDKKSLLEVVNKESHRLSRILEDFLKYGRKKEMKMELCDPSAIIEEIFGMVRHSRKGLKKLEFVQEKDGDIPMIYADQEMLKQAFWNLIVNAMESMPNSGKVRASVKRSNGFLNILLSDTGTGIPAPIIDHIFEPFHTTKKDGTGLGLAIANKMVAMHSGQIEVIENSPAGATFSIRLPISQEKA